MRTYRFSFIEIIDLFAREQDYLICQSRTTPFAE
jgi:hypothetical protein